MLDQEQWYIAHNNFEIKLCLIRSIRMGHRLQYRSLSADCAVSKRAENKLKKI